MSVFHGTTYTSLVNLLSGQSRQFSRLSVTDTAERAQLYADAQATREVATEIRRATGSAVVQMTTTEDLNWIRRDEGHNSLDKCEATIKTWNIVKVIAFTTEYNFKNSVIKVNGSYVNTFEYLTQELGDKLEIVIK